MTVKEAVSVLKTAKTIAITFDGGSFPFFKDNPVMMEAYGNFVVDYIQSVGYDSDARYEVAIAMQPVKAV